MRYALVLLLLCCGCFSQKTRIRTPRLSNDYLLRPPQALQPPLNASLIVRDKAETFRFLAQLEATPDTISLVGFTPFATRAFLISYDGERISFARHIPKALPMKPEKLLAYVQGAVWPELVKAGSWQAQVSENQTLWQWRDGQRPRLEIRYNGLPREPGRVSLRDVTHGLDLTIDLIEVTPAP